MRKVALALAFIFVALGCKEQDYKFVKPGIYIRGDGVKSPGGTLGYTFKRGGEYWGVTAAHLFDGLAGVVVEASKGDSLLRVGVVTRVDESNDLALIQFSGEVTVCTQGIRFPWQTPEHFSWRMCPKLLSKNGLKYVRIISDPVRFKSRFNPDIWMVGVQIEANRALEHGDSGSGIYYQGKLIGIAVVTTDFDIAGGRYGFIIPGPAIADFIEEE